MQKHAKRQIKDSFKKDPFISVCQRCLCVISGQTKMAKEMEYSPRSAVSLKLTADQVLVFNWIAGSTQVNSPKHKRGFIFRALAVARRGYMAILHRLLVLAQSTLFVFFCIFR